MSDELRTLTQEDSLVVIEEIQEMDPTYTLGRIMHWVLTELNDISYVRTLYYTADDTMLSALRRVRRLLEEEGEIVGI